MRISGCVGSVDSKLEKCNSFLLKLSGEILGSNESVFSPEKIDFIITEIKDALSDFKGKFSIVVGGGNITRGKQMDSFKIPRVRADHMGMIATCINGILLTEKLKTVGLRAKVLSALPCGNFMDTYSVERAKDLLSDGYILIFVLGTGNPLFSTDTVAVLRAIELELSTVLKATKVDGVYDKDPVKYENAKMFETLTFEDAIKNELEIMDREAFMLAKEHGIKIRVFNALVKGNLSKVINGDNVGTLIKNAI